MKINKKVFNMTQFALLVAIEALFCFTPLGSLPAVGPIVATLMMIPVVITAIMMGEKFGTLMGFMAGTFSFIVWTFMPPTPITAFIFTPVYSFGEFQGNFGSVLICFVPRILAGTFVALVYNALSKRYKNKAVLGMSVSAVVGSLTNTLLVMLGIWLFFGEQYSSIVGQSILVIIGTTTLFSGIPEAIVAGIIAPLVCKPLKKAMEKF